MKGQRLQVVDFTYLGSILSRVVHIDDEVNAGIAKASAAFGQLHGSIWERSVHYHPHAFVPDMINFMTNFRQTNDVLFT